MSLAKKRIKIDELNTAAANESRFTKWRSQILDMYGGDTPLRNKLANSIQELGGTRVFTIDIESLRNTYYNLSVSLTRGYSRELYAISPIYATKIDSLANMFLWRYTYVPSVVPGKESAGVDDLSTITAAMNSAVEGIALTTSFPTILKNMFIDGIAAVTLFRNTGSGTLTSLLLPADYCTIVAQTQFGSYSVKFDFSYFDNLQLSTEDKKNIAFSQFPKEFRTKYDIYLKDRQNMRLQELDPSFTTAFAVNPRGNPVFFNGVFSQRHYEQYLENELANNSQQLEKLLSHKVPTYEDQLVLEIEEMNSLHKSMSKAISNKNVKLVTTPGEIEVHSIGDDRTKENKTLSNAFASIFNNMGDNSHLYNSDQKFALETTLHRNESFVWGFIQQIVVFYNIAINRAFGTAFKGYQCVLSVLPITHYNQYTLLDYYKDGATLGISKLEYAVGLGISQSQLQAKIALEDVLGLNKLKPLMTSYTQKDNEESVRSGDGKNDEDEDEVIEPNEN